MSNKEDFYRILELQLRELIGEEKDLIANLSNTSALLFTSMEDINWAGFYLMKEGELVLGPFQGKPACIRIGVGKGVCGTSAKNKETLVIENVHNFEGHIACDGASNFEIVIPIMKNGEVLGVLDIDAPIFSRLDDEDRQGLESMVKYIETKV